MIKTPLDAVVSDLAHRVNERWAACGFDNGRFSRIAKDALEKTDLEPLYDPATLIRWAFGSPTIPRQSAGENDFASPGMTVYRTERFRIEILLWAGHLPPTEHDHSSPGAFAALNGPRIHYRYRFEDAVQIARGCKRGVLRHTGPDILDCGDVCEIETLDGLIHSLFFVNGLSTTLSVRSLMPDGPTHLYYWPGIALDCEVLELTTIKRIKALFALRSLDLDRFWGHLRAAAAGEDIATRIFLLMESIDSAASSAQAASLAASLMADCGPLRDHAEQAAVWRWRRQQIERVLPRIDDPEVKLMCGLMWAPSPRDRAFGLLQQSGAAADPIAAVCERVAGLADQTGSVFGMPWDDSFGDILEGLLRGRRWNDLCGFLVERYDAEEVAAQLSSIEHVAASMTGHPVLGAWLDDTTAE